MTLEKLKILVETLESLCETNPKIVRNDGRDGYVNHTSIDARVKKYDDEIILEFF